MAQAREQLLCQKTYVDMSHTRENMSRVSEMWHNSLQTHTAAQSVQKPLNDNENH